MLKKSLLKRIRITRTGKILRRTAGIDHFLSKKNRKLVRNKRRLKQANKTILKY